MALREIIRRKTQNGKDSWAFSKRIEQNDTKVTDQSQSKKLQSSVPSADQQTTVQIIQSATLGIPEVGSETRPILPEETLLNSVGKLAGRLSHFRTKWEKITTDTVILDWISGIKIPFEKAPCQNQIPKEPDWSPIEISQISEKIEELLEKVTIEECESCQREFISPIFLTPKPDSTSRFILNLKNLNNLITTKHFKLEDIRTARDLLHQNSFMVTIDLKDAYYVVSIKKSDRRYLRFKFKEKLFEFCCLPFGLNRTVHIHKVYEISDGIFKNVGLHFRYMTFYWSGTLIIFVKRIEKNPAACCKS